MREVLFAIIPGSVLVYRYAPGFQVARLIGLALMEIAPFLIVAWLEGEAITMVVLGFGVLYSVYELGYVQNDMLSGNEGSGMTRRSQFDRFNSGIFYVFRIAVIAAILSAAYILRGAYFSHIVIYLVAIGCIFLLHNKLAGPRWRIATFISLNTLKILVRLGIIAPAAIMYVCGALPHLAVKLLHYLGAKKVIPISEDMVRSAVLPIYLGCLPVLALVEPKLILFGLPYFLNHYKSQIFSSVQRFVALARA